MERLTEWINNGEDRQAVPKMDLRNNGHQRCCNKLAELEDLQEQGLLVKLPCEVGDEVYYIFAGSCGQDWCNDECFGCEDSRLEIRVCPFCITMIDDIGKTVFLTKAEAEAKLKELGDK